MGRKTDTAKIIEFKRYLGHEQGKVISTKSVEAFERWYKETGSEKEVYPSQGLLTTPFDYLDYLGKTLIPEEELIEILRVRQYLLSVMNHPTRLAFLKKVERQAFTPPPAITLDVMETAAETGAAVSVGDLAAVIMSPKQERLSRRDLLATGPFIKLGKHARIPFVGGAMPDIYGSAAALATAAACQALVSVPRNGLFSEVDRQVNLVKAAFAWMEREELLKYRKDKADLLELWQRNIMGVLEPELKEGMERADKLYAAGVRAFRVYSPEPGKEAVRLVKKLVTTYGETIEIFAGQVVTYDQAKAFETAGADGIYIGIGGGGRCITALRSGSTVDWPRLLWEFRGKLTLPVIVEGGASDHVGVTLLLGASGIGVSRIAGGGTIESPGGLLYLVDRTGTWFKPYGGEASARTKFLDKIMLPLGIPAFVEGETTKAVKSYITHIKPTIAASLYFLMEDVILSLVFRGVASIPALQAIDPSPLRRISEDGWLRQRTH